MEDNTKTMQIEKLYKTIYGICKINLYDKTSFESRFANKAIKASFALYKQALQVHFNEMGYKSDDMPTTSLTPNEFYDEIITLLKELFKIVMSFDMTAKKEDQLDKFMKKHSLV